MKKLNRNNVIKPTVLTAKKVNDEHSHNIAAVLAGNYNDIEKKVYQSKANDKEIKKSILAMGNGKCSYCGQTTKKDVRLDVEHYRPIGAVVYNRKLKFEFGYYWLSAEWENLLPSCSPCNSLDTREIFDHVAKTWSDCSVGKGNRFPLYSNNPKHGPSPSMNISHEIPLIYNPANINPCHLFDFEKFSDIKCGKFIFVKPHHSCTSLQKQIASTTIDILGLNRMQLCKDRYTTTLDVETTLTNIENEFNGTSSSKKTIADEMISLIALIDLNKNETTFTGLIWKFYYGRFFNIAQRLIILEVGSGSLKSQQEIVNYFKDFMTRNAMTRRAPARLIPRHFRY